MHFRKLIKVMKREYTKEITPERKAQLDRWSQTMCAVQEVAGICKEHAEPFSDTIIAFLKKHDGKLVYHDMCAHHQAKFIEDITATYGKPA